MTERKGATSRAAVDPGVLERLHQGVEESATLSEALAVDFGLLLGTVIPDIPPATLQCVIDAQGLGITKRMDLMATVLVEYLGDKAADRLKVHRSDTVRGWAAFIIGKDARLSLAQKVSDVRSLADDPHFGVREWAWLALRTAIASDIEHAIELLEPWTRSESDYIRRFAIEATRPRGVWSKHIEELKQAPQLAQGLLDRVMQDPSRYVQDSCGNWLNDAAKSQPQWVVEYCRAWRGRNSSAATHYIVKRGLRNILRQ